MSKCLQIMSAKQYGLRYGKCFKKLYLIKVGAFASYSIMAGNYAHNFRCPV